MTGAPPITAPDDVAWTDFRGVVADSGLFEPGRSIYAARAPGRLDVLGGVADYSGSSVLQTTAAATTAVAWQERRDQQFVLRSVGLDPARHDTDVIVQLDDLVGPDGAPRGWSDVRIRLAATDRRRWVAYPLGCYFAMLRAYVRTTGGLVDDRVGRRGATILIASDVPEGAGVSSSASVEVATMVGAAYAYGVEPSDLTLAGWCQRAENLAVGAPCGIMDQVTSALGRGGQLLHLLCRPAVLKGFCTIPSGYRFVALDSGVKHSVGGARYRAARASAFMGLAYIRRAVPAPVAPEYITELFPDEFARLAPRIPETVSGEQFLAEFQAIPDAASSVDRDRRYFPRAAAEHAVLEHAQCQRAAEVLGDDVAVRDDARGCVDEVGAAMYQSHASYANRLNLGAQETDHLVNLLREHGTAGGVHGARVSGGGCGGAVVACIHSDTEASAGSLCRVISEYQTRTGLGVRLLEAGANGALAFGVHAIQLGAKQA